MSYPSTLADLRREVQNAVGLAAGTDDAVCNDWINQIYADVAVETEAFVLYATGTLTVAAATYALPVEVIRINEVMVTNDSSTTYGPPLLETQLAQILGWRQSGSTGTPTNYAVAGYHMLELYPTPAQANTILFYYTALPTPLSADADTAFLQEPYGSFVLKYGAMAEAANFLQHPSEQEYRQLYDMWLRKYRGNLNRRRGGHVLSIPVTQPWGVIPSSASADWGSMFQAVG